MTDSLSDQLLKLGFRKPEPVARAAPQEKSGQRDGVRSAARHERSGVRDSVHKNENAGGKPHPPADQRRDRIRSSHAAGSDRQPKPSGRSQAEIDLGKAYALRAQHEKNERIEAERLKQEAARIKREAKLKVAALLCDKTLNAADAELTRHFEYNGKIRRVHVTAPQLKALNAGELAIVQLDGRYLLVDAPLAREVQTLLPSLIALLVDPNAPSADDPYADPQYQVPDDLAW